ncbi:MEDS domain-containing protein [Sporosarcina sp. 6E9]|uniref:MEDS domain-containing protein n=1 Tax=Sporosarcina sp. 6E9 TaxID=2819235 RepID=UPI001B302C26|nr:MEDS domain-containing protein [Sporosarcina sp. 6E9]
MKSKMDQLLEKENGHLHFLYKYNGPESYLEQILSYIEDGLAAGDYVIIIENDRLFPKIHKEMSTRFTAEQMELVHYVNSFDFYWSSGSYHPPSIAEYFSKTIQPYLESNITFRAWAHVEWASMKEPLHLIEDLEKIVDEAVCQLAFPLVCAYEGERMPEYLRKTLMETHPYLLIEDDFIVSEEYQPTKLVK